ncbi:MAG TPA: dihydrolipoyl dehydrogenase [Candidatus Limnocylindrales bacterium]|nr:dihydrolipoyl dehydrogenase [Candidatus Limnocylindrales bacterium]
MAVGSSNDFDLVVLGAGTGGYAAAFRASQLGLRVALVDEDKLGGTCLHRGCIPTKALLESAAFNERLKHAADFGLNLGGETSVDYAKIAARRDMVVNRMWKGVQSLVKKYDVTWIAGRGRLDGATKVRVRMAGDDGTPGAGGERVLNASDVILATGSRVKSLPGIVPDGARIVTSDDVLRMDTMPSSVIIIGAGAVGTEFASMYHDLGAQVTLLEYLPAVVPLEDRDVSKELERSFTRRGIKVMTNARFDADSVKADADGVSITVGPDGKDRAEIRAEMLLVAAGRATNVEDVGLESTHAEVDRGYVKVDGHMRTAEPHLYAIGDIVGGLMLAHTAAHEGIIAAHTIAGDPDVHAMDYVKQPRATYSRPEIASVGITEQEAEKQGLPTKIAKIPFQAVGKALIGGEYEGFTKIIAHKETDETLGIHIIGPHATDLIAEASLALTLEAVPWEIGSTTHAHPTYSEILGETAMAVDGRSINF